MDENGIEKVMVKKMKIRKDSVNYFVFVLKLFFIFRMEKNILKSLLLIKQLEKKLTLLRKLLRIKMEM